MRKITNDCQELITYIKTNFKDDYFIDNIDEYSKKVNGLKKTQGDQLPVLYRRVQEGVRMKVFLGRVKKDPGSFFKRKYYDIFDDSLLIDPVECILQTNKGPKVVEVNKNSAIKFEESGTSDFLKNMNQLDSKRYYRIKDLDMEIFQEVDEDFLNGLIFNDEGEFIVKLYEQNIDEINDDTTKANESIADQLDVSQS